MGRRVHINETIRRNYLVLREKFRPLIDRAADWGTEVEDNKLMTLYVRYEPETVIEALVRMKDYRIVCRDGKGKVLYRTVVRVGADLELQIPYIKAKIGLK